MELLYFKIGMNAFFSKKGMLFIVALNKLFNYGDGINFILWFE